MVRIENLKAKTWSKKIIAEILDFMPTVATSRKQHIAGIGYVYFLYDANNNKIGKCSKCLTQRNTMVLYFN